MKRLVFAIACVALFGGEALAVSEGAPAALQPLLTPSARGAGMAQAFVAVADDATASYWNPAALGLQDRASVAFMYSKLVPDLADDIAYYHFAYARPGWGGTIAASVIFLSFGESIFVDEQGQQGENFTSFDFVPQISYGNQLTDRLALGFSFKFVYSKLSDPIPELNISDGIGKSIAGDASFLYLLTKNEEAWYGRTRLGVIFQNFGPNIAYNDEDQAESLPRMARIGVAWEPVLVRAREEDGLRMHKLLLTAEVTQPLTEWEPFDQPFKVNTPEIWKGGTEYTFYDFVSLRAGYIHDDDGDITDYTYGAGFSLKRVSSVGLRFDYASFPQATDLDRVNRFALSYDF